MNKKKVIIIGVVVLALSIGAVVYLKRKKGATTAGPLAVVTGAPSKERTYILDYATTHGLPFKDIEGVKAAPEELIVKMYEALVAHDGNSATWTGLEKLNGQWENAWASIRKS